METTELIVELARQIEAQQAYNRVGFWVWLVLLTFVSGGLGAFVASYLKKRGETQAIQTDLETIKKQQTELAQAVARVQTDIGHEDWKKRELTTLRRQKLEKLLIAAGRCAAWTFHEAQAILGRRPEPTKENPIAVVNSFTLSYFPGLIFETLRLYVCQGEMLQVARREQLRRLTAQAVGGNLPAAEPMAEQRLTLIHTLLMAQADLVVLVGAGIMRDLLGGEAPPKFDTLSTQIRDGALTELRKFLVENNLAEPKMMEAFREELAASAIAARKLR